VQEELHAGAVVGIRKGQTFLLQLARLSHEHQLGRDLSLKDTAW
jgi:hypothetical protein